MGLFVIRHAEAVPHHTPGYADDARPLTDTGHDQARRLGELFRRLEIRFDSIVTSPLVRAWQTTEGILADWPDPRPAVLTLDEIAGEMRPRRVVKYLKKLGQPTVGLVGHEPTLSRYIAWMIGSKKSRIGLEKAGFARLTCDDLEKGGATLNCLITPEWY